MTTVIERLKEVRHRPLLRSALLDSWPRASGHASVSHYPCGTQCRSADPIVGRKESIDNLRVLKDHTKEGCSDVRGGCFSVPSRSRLRGIYRVVNQ